MKQRIFLTTLLCMTAIASWAYDFAFDGLYYNILNDDEQTAEVTYKDESYNSYSGTVTIPRSVSNGGVTYKVTAVGTNAFSGSTQLTSVTIGSSVTTIRDLAFFGCSSLATLTLGYAVNTIGKSAFANCSALTAVSFPSSVKNIGKSAFYNCPKLKSVEFASGKTVIGTYAFAKCTSLTSVTIPNESTSVGGGCFYGCTALESVYLPLSVKAIGSSAFFDCSNLQKIVSENEVPPVVMSYGLHNVPTSCTVSVPTDGVKAYKEMAGWGQFVIKPAF